MNTEAATSPNLVIYVLEHAPSWVAGIVIIITLYVVAALVARAITEVILRRTDIPVESNSIVLIRRVSKIVFVSVGIIVAMAINGIPVATTAAAISLGIGYAGQATIANFFSSLVLLMQKRIRLNDLIRVGDVIGRVNKIDSKVTVLKSIDGTEVMVPNQIMLNTNLINYSINPKRRIELKVAAQLTMPLEQITSLAAGIVEKNTDIEKAPEPLVLVDSLENGIASLTIYCWIKSGVSWLKVRSNLTNRIKKAFDEVGVSIPFPIRTLKLDEDNNCKNIKLLV